MTKGEAKPQKDAPTVAEKSAGFSLANFFKDTKNELDKVVWPTRQQLISESSVVILMVVLAALLINGVDWVFVQLAKQVF